MILNIHDWEGSGAKPSCGDHVRSKSDTAMVSEVLGKILCHNICCVIASQCELGIEPMFWRMGRLSKRS
jgi:hypothetical protein